MKQVVLILALTALPILAQEERLPVPSSIETRKAEKTIKDLFGDRFKAKGRKEQRELALELLKQGTETKDDPVSRFVLLRQSREIASEALALKVALEAVAVLVKGYEVDPPKEYGAVLSVARRQLKSPKEAGAVAAYYNYLGGSNSYQGFHGRNCRYWVVSP